MSSPLPRKNFQIFGLHTNYNGWIRHVCLLIILNNWQPTYFYMSTMCQPITFLIPNSLTPLVAELPSLYPKENLACDLYDLIVNFWWSKIHKILFWMSGSIKWNNVTITSWGLNSFSLLLFWTYYSRFPLW